MNIRARILALAFAFALPAAATAQTLQRDSSNVVRFTNGDVRLTGWLDLPEGRGPFPVVILVGGNAPSWRGYDWFFDVLADSLNADGIGIFYYDHRGDGASTGSWTYSTYEQLADDVIAAAHAVARNPRVNPGSIGVFGHSMGGWIAPLAAARSPDIAFVITAAGAGVAPLIQTSYDHMMRDIAGGTPRETAIEMDALRRELWAYYTQPVARRQARAQEVFDWAKTRPWFNAAREWRELRGVSDALPPVAVLQSMRFDSLIAELRRDAVYDPTSPLQRVNVPMLALFGEKDNVVPRELSIAAMRTAFEVSGNTDLTVTVFPDANHMLMTGSSRTADALAPGFLPALRAWLKTAADL